MGYSLDLDFQPAGFHTVDHVGLLVACGVLTAAVVALVVVFRPRARLMEKRVAAALGLKRRSGRRITGRFQLRRVELTRLGPASGSERPPLCRLTVSLSPDWLARTPSKGSPLEAKVDELLRQFGNARRDGAELLCFDVRWPFFDGPYSSKERLAALLREACAAATGVDSLLKDELTAHARRVDALQDDFRKAGFHADGPGAWVGSPGGCDLRLERRGEKCFLFAPLGPGWPADLTVELPWARRAAKGRRDEVPDPIPVDGATLPLEATSPEPERARRLFAHATREFHEAMRSVFLRFPEPWIERSQLSLHFGAWGMTADEVLQLLAPVCRFLREVYRCTDWPEKRGVAPVPLAEAEPRPGLINSAS